MDKLEHYRKGIDIIDKRLIRLFLLRFKLAGRIAQYKKIRKIGISDKKRERQVFKNVKKLSNKKNQKFLIGIFKNVMDYSKKLQK